MLSAQETLKPLLTRFRLASDGSLSAPHRGKPPACPDGYYTDPYNPFHYLPEIQPCEHRVRVTEKSACCGSVTHTKCTKLNKSITDSACLVCKGRAMKICLVIYAENDKDTLRLSIMSIMRQMMDNLDILIVNGDDIKEVADDFKIPYTDSLESAEELTDAEYIVEQSGNLYHVGNCIEQLLEPVLRDSTAASSASIHIDVDGLYKQSIERDGKHSEGTWEMLPYGDPMSLIGYRREREGIHYVGSDARAVELRF